MMKVVTTRSVQLVLDRLNRTHQAFLVGGCVRDTLLGLVPNDFDVATSATPDQVVELFNDFTVVLTGLQHGTVVVVVDGEEVEVTTFRTDGSSSDGRRPDEVVFTDDLVTDLARRDFTMNAIAFNDEVGLVDPFGGANDLANGVLRTVGNPADRFNEDTLRVLRLFRFAMRFNLNVDSGTMDVAKDFLANDRLANLSSERVADELSKMLVHGNHDNLDLLESVVRALFTDLNVDCVQNNPHHCFDVLTHTFHSVANVDNELHLRLAMLLHDVAKPVMKTTGDDGVDHFYNHPNVGADMTVKLLKGLKFDNKTVKTVHTLVKFHDRDVAATKKSVRKLLNKLGGDVDAFNDLLRVKRADALAQHPDVQNDKLNHLDNVAKVLDDVLADDTAVSLKDLAVNGHDLMRLGLSGKDVGAALNNLLSVVLDDPNMNDKNKVLNLL